MAEIDKVHPTPVARGTIQRLNHQTVYKVVLSNAGLAVMATDAAAAKVTDALGSFCSIMQVKANGSEMFLVADKHSTTRSSVASFIASVLDTGVFTVADNGTTATATLSDSQTVAVTEPTDLEGM